MKSFSLHILQDVCTLLHVRSVHLVPNYKPACQTPKQQTMLGQRLPLHVA